MGKWEIVEQGIGKVNDNYRFLFPVELNLFSIPNLCYKSREGITHR